MKLIINIPEKALNVLKTDGVDWLGAEHILDAVSKGVPYEERPQGEWIVDEEHSITMTFYKCTNCNWFGGVTWYKFCPICGADMLKEAKNE